jgi:hypothetical protein
MRASEDAVALSLPGSGTGVRLGRSLLAAFVVLGSAGIGYAGSRIWPLRELLGSETHFAAAAETGPIQPASAPSLTASNSQLTAKPEPQTSRDPFSHSVPVATVPSASETPTAGRGATTAAPGANVAVLHPAPPAHADAASEPKTNDDVRNNERATATRRKVESVRAYRPARNQGTIGGAPKPVEFAPNPRPDQASRDYMGTISRN